MKTKLKLLTLACCLGSASAFSFTVGNKLEGSLSAVKKSLNHVHRHANLTGHEEITRQAIILAKEVASKNNISVPKVIASKVFNNLKPEQFGLVGSEATNPLIQGNYATDFPFTKKFIVNLPEFWKFKGMTDNMQWQDHPKTQKFHFLRNHLQAPDETGSILVGQRQSCEATRNAITLATKQASLYFRKEATSPEEKDENVRKSLFFLGHATHMIQDSFSEAHGRRERLDESPFSKALRPAQKRNHDIQEICYFGFNLDAVQNPLGHKTRLNSCHHSAMEIVRDGIWIRDSHSRNRVHSEWPEEVVIDDDVREIQRCARNYSMKMMDTEKCLKHTPRLARTATAKYLLAMMTYMHKKDTQDMKSYLMENLFEGSLGLEGLDETMPEGILRCGNLPK